MRILKLLAPLCLCTAVPLHAAPPDPEALARSRQCFTCHAVDTTTYAPSFKDIAHKYSAKSDVEMLMKKLQNGGPQHWGDLAMPSSKMLGKPMTDEEARTLVLWVLSR